MSTRTVVKLVPPDPSNAPGLLQGPPGVGNISINSDGTFSIPMPAGGQMIPALLASGWAYSTPAVNGGSVPA